jgi:hypothetical protein
MTYKKMELNLTRFLEVFDHYKKDHVRFSWVFSLKLKLSIYSEIKKWAFSIFQGELKKSA